MKSLLKVPNSAISKSLLRDDFIVPPFSILDAKTKYWMDRKHMWEMVLHDRADNIRNTISKGNTAYCNSFTDGKYYGLESKGSISTFDPFLAEILIKWFSRPGWTVLDPFAGGIVRGAVCGMCGRKYWGVDISKEQVFHNQAHWMELLHTYTDIKEPAVHWVEDDTEKHDFGFKFDFMLTCPPYYDLERYTDNPDDLSNLSTYEAFIQKYDNIINLCYNWLKDDTFAVIVVSEIRNPKGVLYGFVPDTINAFKKAGFQYYNEIILENRVVSLKIRSPKYFNQSRKVGKHHQNVLVFYKGNLDNIENKFGKFKENQL